MDRCFYMNHPLYPYIVDVCWWLICYCLYKFETIVDCSTLLFSLGTYISFSSLFLEYYRLFQVCCAVDLSPLIFNIAYIILVPCLFLIILIT